MKVRRLNIVNISLCFSFPRPLYDSGSSRLQFVCAPMTSQYRRPASPGLRHSLEVWYGGSGGGRRVVARCLCFFCVVAAWRDSIPLHSPFYCIQIECPLPCNYHNYIYINIFFKQRVVIWRQRRDPDQIWSVLNPAIVLERIKRPHHGRPHKQTQYLRIGGRWMRGKVAVLKNRMKIV